MSAQVRLVRFAYRKSIEAELRRDRKVVDGLDAGAEKIARAARGLSPIRTGRYRSSITVARARGTGRGDISTVSASVPYAVFVEWGTRNMAADHPLARATDIATRSFGGGVF